jgi:hypothetical protein
MLTEISARAVRVSRHVDAEDGAPIRGRVAFEEWLLDERDPARSPVGAFTAGVFSLSNRHFAGAVSLNSIGRRNWNRAPFFPSENAESRPP